ncbi:MAG: hypothetical protein IKX84_07630, partial [Clostridia bacterium]|nr:hypothetical protein [Clostridia bacterium]
MYRSGIDIDVTDAEVDARFMEYVEDEKAYFQGNVSLHETYERRGYTMNWQPDGYRGILHILISADGDALSAYGSASGEEAKAEAAAAVVASVQDTLDEIYKALEDGEEFTSLIEKYNIDPGMQDEENLKNGYAVHKDGITYVDEFT